MSFAQFSMDAEIEVLHLELDYFEPEPSRLSTLQLIKQRVHEIINNKYFEITQTEIVNISDCLEEIQQRTHELQEIYKNDENLQEKLIDIDQELEGYFSNKIDLEYLKNDYEALYQQYEVLRQKMSNNNPQKLFEEKPQDQLQEYKSILKKLDSFAIFRNDIVELQKMKERFLFLLEEENYLKYQQLVKPPPESPALSNLQIVRSYIKMISECITANAQQSHLKIQIDNPQEIQNIGDYKLIIFLLQVDNISMLIYLNCQLKTILPICISQQRQQSKQFLTQFQEQIADFKTKFLLLKEDDLLKTIYQTFTNILIDDAKILRMQDQFPYDEMLEKMRQYILYQVKLEQLDCFEFMDHMKIELTPEAFYKS